MAAGAKLDVARRKACANNRPGSARKEAARATASSSIWVIRLPVPWIVLVVAAVTLTRATRLQRREQKVAREKDTFYFIT